MSNPNLVASRKSVELKKITHAWSELWKIRMKNPSSERRTRWRRRNFRGCTGNGAEGSSGHRVIGSSGHRVSQDKFRTKVKLFFDLRSSAQIRGKISFSLCPLQALAFPMSAMTCDVGDLGDFQMAR